MTGVLLVNMGGATSQKEMKIFLSRMFIDPFIIPLGNLPRIILSFIISNTRYKKSWKKYELIGGTPIISATQKTMNVLQKELSDSYKIKIAFSYSSPFIDESLLSFYNSGIKNIVVIPLYPQSSFTTTSSVISDAKKVLEQFSDMKLQFVNEFYKHESFINFWGENINDHIKKENYNHPYLIFSAHSIPKYLIEKGDTYQKAIEANAANIAHSLGFEYECAYQSQMKKDKWIGPDVKERLKTLAESGKEEIVIVPISFVNENLETLYDLDMDIIPYGKDELKIKNISRVAIAEADPLFIKLLVDIIRNHYCPVKL